MHDYVIMVANAIYFVSICTSTHSLEYKMALKVAMSVFSIAHAQLSVLTTFLKENICVGSRKYHTVLVELTCASLLHHEHKTGILKVGIGNNSILSIFI